MEKRTLFDPFLPPLFSQSISSISNQMNLIRICSSVFLSLTCLGILLIFPLCVCLYLSQAHLSRFILIQNQGRLLHVIKLLSCFQIVSISYLASLTFLHFLSIQIDYLMIIFMRFTKKFQQSLRPIIHLTRNKFF